MPAALAGTVALIAVATALAATPKPEPVDTGLASGTRTPRAAAPTGLSPREVDVAGLMEVLGPPLAITDSAS